MEDSGVFSGCFLRNNEDVTTKSADLYSDHQLSKSIQKPLPVPDKYVWRYQTLQRADHGEQQ